MPTRVVLTGCVGPLQLLKHIDYPPVCQVMGDADDIFEISHVHDFHEALKQRGVKCKKIIVSSKGHAFDI
jgi:predicted esterase